MKLHLKFLEELIQSQPGLLMHCQSQKPFIGRMQSVNIPLRSSRSCQTYFALRFSHRDFSKRGAFELCQFSFPFNPFTWNNFKNLDMIS